VLGDEQTYMLIIKQDYNGETELII
jgi:hypothetical protein